jgi:tripartite-type tricarboxylate transporter receptor subunit TctC
MIWFQGFTPARADSVEDFYRGRQVRLIVGNPAGSLYDIWGRLMARHWGDFLPGRPNFVVQNMPGAGQIVAANYIYNIADKDGTVVALSERALPYRALIGDPNIRFDPRKFNWIGSTDSINRVCTSIAGTPVQKATDLFEHELLVGGDGAGSNISNTPNMLAKLLGMKFKVVEGYDSGEHIILAMEKGELQGICDTLTDLRSARPGWIEQGKFKILFSLERDPVPGLNAPTAYEFTKTEEQRQVLSLYNSSVEFGRPTIAPPGIPSERVTALRRSFDAMMSDPAFAADAHQLGFTLTLRKGEVLQSLAEKLMETPKDVIQRTIALTR